MQTIETLREVATVLQSDAQRAKRSEQAAAYVEKAVQVLDESRSGDRLTENGRAKISEANKNLWVVCPRGECDGVRHRATHPHIKGMKNKPHLVRRPKAA